MDERHVVTRRVLFQDGDFRSPDKGVAVAVMVGNVVHGPIVVRIARVMVGMNVAVRVFERMLERLPHDHVCMERAGKMIVEQHAPSDAHVE